MKLVAKICRTEDRNIGPLFNGSPSHFHSSSASLSLRVRRLIEAIHVVEF
jgi:hypothetical protein